MSTETESERRLRILESMFGDDAEPASKQASPIEDWTEGVTADGRRYLQDPKFPKNVKWLSDNAPILRDTEAGIKRYNTETGQLESVPGGEKGDSDDARWTQNLKRLEAQTQLNKSELELQNYQTPAEKEAQAIRIANASRAPEKTPEQIYQEEKAKIKAQRENFEWRVSQGFEITPEETEALRVATNESLEKIRQANALALQAQQGADARALAAEQSRLRVQEFETTEKPYKDEDLRLKREASDLARGQAQAGVLAKQAEAGQEMVKSMVGWAAPSIETVRAAYSPLQTALRILNSGTRTATTPPSVTAPPPIQPAPNPV